MNKRTIKSDPVGARRAGRIGKARRITVRLTEEQYTRAISRAKDWQSRGTGSRSLNDWCLIQLIGEANDETKD